ncbi:MAG TPA: glucose 1-dehydrogenase [Candidatus Limnocylindria bacterium]
MGAALRLSDKVAIVTGSSRGIGKATAIRLAAEGARVVVHGHENAGALAAIVTEIEGKGGAAIAVAADIGLRADVERLFADTVRAFGRVDVLVNNAAWSDPTAHLLELDEAQWDAVLRTNLKGPYLATHRAANLMVDQGGGGSIVNITSFGGARAHRNMAAYDASKGGIEAFTRAAALDLGPFGIRVNAVGPGAIHTEKFEAMGPEAKARRGEVAPLGRVGEADEVARVIAFLASDEASYVTGQVIYVDGGVLAQLRSPQADVGLPPSVAARRAKKRG